MDINTHFGDTLNPKTSADFLGSSYQNNQDTIITELIGLHENDHSDKV